MSAIKSIKNSISQFLEEPSSGIQAVIDAERQVGHELDKLTSRKDTCAQAWRKWAKGQKEDVEEVLHGYEIIYTQLHTATADFKKDFQQSVDSIKPIKEKEEYFRELVKRQKNTVEAIQQFRKQNKETPILDGELSKIDAEIATYAVFLERSKRKHLRDGMNFQFKALALLGERLKTMAQHGYAISDQLSIEGSVAQGRSVATYGEAVGLPSILEGFQKRMREIPELSGGSVKVPPLAKPPRQSDNSGIALSVTLINQKEVPKAEFSSAEPLNHRNPVKEGDLLPPPKPSPPKRSNLLSGRIVVAGGPRDSVELGSTLSAKTEPISSPSDSAMRASASDEAVPHSQTDGSGFPAKVASGPLFPVEKQQVFSVADSAANQDSLSASPDAPAILTTTPQPPKRTRQYSASSPPTKDESLSYINVILPGDILESKFPISDVTSSHNHPVPFEISPGIPELAAREEGIAEENGADSNSADH